LEGGKISYAGFGLGGANTGQSKEARRNDVV